jgi:hypothetical protein
MDKVGADPIKVLNELMQYDLLSTEFGGEVEVGRISAKSGEGLDELLEKVTHIYIYIYLHICTLTSNILLQYRRVNATVRGSSTPDSATTAPARAERVSCAMYRTATSVASVALWAPCATCIHCLYMLV